MGTTTEFSDNFQIKLIGTGREAGTWGDSMNENLKRIEAAMGKSIDLDIEGMPIGSTDATSASSWVATWVTVDSADEGEAGSEGRARMVDVQDQGGLLATPTLLIAGSESSEVPARLLYIKNNLTSHDLTVSTTGATDTVSIANGSFALVLVVPSATANYGIGVHNLMKDIQIPTGMNFESGSTVTFGGGANDVVVPTTQTAALSFSDGTDDYLDLDTTNGKLIVGDTIDLDFQKNIVSIEFGTTNISTLAIKDYLDTPMLILNRNADKLQLEVDLDLNADITTDTQASTHTVIDNNAIAFRWRDSTSDIITIDSRTGAFSVDFSSDVSATGTVSAPDVLVTGTDGYINFDTTESSAGIGVRNNAGEIEIKNSSSDVWGAPYGVGLVNGEGVYFKSSDNLGNVSLATTTGSEAHLLARAPRIVIAKLVCNTSDRGYAIGDEVLLTQFGDGAGTSAFTVGANSSNVFYSRVGSHYISNKSTGAWIAITIASWDLVVECWE